MYSLLSSPIVQLFFLLSHYGIIGTGFDKDIKAGAQLILEDKMEILENATSLAGFLHGKTPVIYCAAQYEGVAIRFRQQLNENGKMLCWHHVFPEMNHNELVGWRKKDDSLAIFIFRDLDDYVKTSQRIDICKDVFKKYTPNIHEVWCKGDSFISKAIYFIHLGDWVSYFLAQKNEVDAMEIDVINMLKTELGKN